MAGHRLRIENVTHRFGSYLAVNAIDLSVAGGEMIALLGPSGCGKSTLLRIVSGFIAQNQGRVLFDDEPVDHLKPNRRGTGIVFQNYALFPHMTIADNIAYGLEAQRWDKAKIAPRVKEMLDLVHMDHLADRFPRQLSGGQQQRVALARCLAVDPKILLLDEPFGALDRKLRETMQLEVRRLQRRLGLTTIFITHDQEEALVLSDRIAVMNKGRIQQVATTTEIYERPANDFVADFVGESNIFRGTVTEPGVVSLEGGRRLLVNGTARTVGARMGVLMRPERFGRGTNVFAGEVKEAVYLGSSIKLRIACDDGLELIVRQPARGPLPAPGTRLSVSIDPGDIHVFA